MNKRDERIRMLMMVSACGGRLIGRGSSRFGTSLFCFDGLSIHCARGFKSLADSMGYRTTEVRRQENIVGIGHRDYVEAGRDGIT